MKVRVCPKCGKHNLEDAFNCIECGTTLSMKTLIDTAEWPAAPIVAQRALSSISPYFKEEVADILKTVRNGFEDVMWGCNITQVARRGPFKFGYLILTSQRLICVYFKSAAGFGRPKRPHLDLTSPTLMVVLEILFGWLFGNFAKLFAVTSLDSPLTQAEKNSKTVIIHDLRTLVSAKAINSWYGETLLTNLIIRFGESNEMTITFIVAEESDRAYKLLVAHLKQ